MSNLDRDGDQIAAPSPDDSVVANSSTEQHCQTVAYMAALATWLDRKLPEILHVALSDGVSPADAAAAAGITVNALARRWQHWAQQPGTVTEADYNHVHALLANADRQT